MNKGRCESFKVFGQRSIIPTPSVSSTTSRGCEDGARVESRRVSLSEFLDRKVGRVRGDSQFPGKIGSEAKQFASPLCRSDGNGNGFCDSGIGTTAGRGVNRCSVRDEVIFEQFKRACNDKERGDCVVEVDSGGRRESPGGDGEEKESRKRRDPFRGENHIPPKHVIILGYGPEPKQEQKDYIHFRNKKRRHIYNHYANGGGFWDGEMEGIDSEEVGCKETWEGIGSTTLGELEWN